MTWRNESRPQSRGVETAAVVTHGRVDVEEALNRVRDVADRVGVRLVEEPRDADLAIVLGGDGTMLRTLARLLGSDTPVIGVNFGGAGFLAWIRPADLERDLEAGLAGEYRSVRA